MSTQQAVRHVEGEVRELIRRTGLDPSRDPRGVRRLVQDAVQDYDERSLHGGLPQLGEIRAAVHSILAVVAGYGPLQQYFDDPTVEEIWINEPSRVFVARGGVAELTPTILTSDEVRDLVERMLKTSGRRVDLSSPFVDATLPDGSRLHVVIPDISRAHWQVNVRKFVVKADRLEDLVRLGTLTKQAADFLAAAVSSFSTIRAFSASGRPRASMSALVSISASRRLKSFAVTARRTSWLTSSGEITCQESILPSSSVSMPHRLPLGPSQRYWSALVL